MDAKEYSKWISDVRDRKRVTQEEFGKMVCHYVQKDGQKVCGFYKRGQVRNWEKAESLPENLEAFISIALIDFDLQYPKKEWDLFYREERYRFVNEKMYGILGSKLYGRRIYEMLLIQVCRGILSFQEVLELEPELRKIVQEVILDKEGRAELAVELHTKRINETACQCLTKEDIIQLVKEEAGVYQTGERTLGERFKKCFETRKRYIQKISLPNAIQVYAPNYKGSYNRMCAGETITRRWLIDLCVHLRFSREEIQYVLKCALQWPLSEEPSNPEYYFRESYYPIGSVKWYKELELQTSELFKGRYESTRFNPEGLENVTFKQKIMFAMLVTIYVMDSYVMDLPPVDYILENLYFYDRGRKACNLIAEYVEEIDSEADLYDSRFLEEVQKKTKKWGEYIKKIVIENAQREKTRTVYESYRMEFQEYFSFARNEDSTVENREEAEKYRYLSAVLYTILTDKYYNNRLNKEEFDQLQEWLEGQMECGDYIFKFFALLFKTFLDGEVLYENPAGGFYIIENGRCRQTFSFEGIFSVLFEILILLEEEGENQK